MTTDTNNNPFANLSLAEIETLAAEAREHTTEAVIVDSGLRLAVEELDRAEAARRRAIRHASERRAEATAKREAVQAAVRACIEAGLSLTTVGRVLGVDRTTARRLARPAPTTTNPDPAEEPAME